MQLLFYCKASTMHLLAYKYNYHKDTASADTLYFILRRRRHKFRLVTG